MNVQNSTVVQASALPKSELNLRSALRILQFSIAGVLFLFLATANGAGYRYGGSDQAFYIPGVMRVLDASLVPSSTELPGPIVVAESATADVVATEVRAVTDGSLVTVVVAVLVRDSLRREDHVVLAGFRACTER